MMPDYAGSLYAYKPFVSSIAVENFGISFHAFNYFPFYLSIQNFPII